jgi:hypothetical protein
MKPLIVKDQFVLTDGKKSFVVFCQKGAIHLTEVDLEKQYLIEWLDPKTGAIIKKEQVLGASLTQFEFNSNAAIIAWIKPN